MLRAGCESRPIQLVRHRATTQSTHEADESGAILVFALVFLMAVSLIVTGLLTFVGTSLHDSNAFSNERNVESAATNAVNLAIQDTRYTFDTYALLDSASPKSVPSR